MADVLTGNRPFSTDYISRNRGIKNQTMCEESKKDGEEEEGIKRCRK